MRCLVHLGLIALMFFLLSLVCIRELLLVPPSNVFFILAGVVGGALGWYCGSDIHVMLTLRRRSRQVVVTNEKLNGPDMVGELF